MLVLLKIRDLNKPTEPKKVLQFKLDILPKAGDQLAIWREGDDSQVENVLVEEIKHVLSHPLKIGQFNGDAFQDENNRCGQQLHVIIGCIPAA
ncbi:hypothetical protein [Hyphomonas oceanitis]|uniref:hypothetical protein n=1 Tax=Hyphomonas oceanitis TaxID=81033 RepID=UPI0012ECAF82|nr:hypothetical protein [Hyphomonas oceanitis]